MFAWMVPIGIAIGALGSLVGAGGGFLIVPLLLFVYPAWPSEVITATSLFAVSMNGAASTLAYAKRQRIDYRAAGLFIATGIPGAALGAWMIRFVPREVFRTGFGALMLVSCLYLLFGRQPKDGASLVDDARGRTLVDRNGTTFRYRYNALLGSLLSLVIGFVASIAGIGGGTVQVPVMIRVLGFPPHVATATSNLILAVGAGTAVAVHFFHGTYSGSLHPVLELTVGVVIGAPLGAWLSDRVHGRFIVRALAAAIGLVGLRILVWP